MAQSWLGSILEAKTNIAIGFALNFGLNCLLLPVMFDPAHAARSAFLLGLVFTVVSVIRQLVIRRWFNTVKRFEVVAGPTVEVPEPFGDTWEARRGTHEHGGYFRGHTHIVFENDEPETVKPASVARFGKSPC